MYLSGTSSRRKNSSYCQRLSSSFSQDLIFAITNGKIKTSKHITLGLALKGMTNSKKVINILNRYGHSCSYTVLEELETEATFSSTTRSDVCPDDIVHSSDLCTGLAFNNFDRFVDTASGKDTLHDTVGIIFQEVHSNSANVNEHAMGSVSEIDQTEEEAGSSSRKRRRTFDIIEPDIKPYPKKPKLEETLLPLDDPMRSTVSVNLTSSKSINFSWMLSHFLEIPNTPMWVGFNNLIYDDTTSKQRVSYLTTVNLSPSNKAVVRHTMLKGLQVAEERNENYMQITYDLAIAKIALQIQCEEKPLFDKLFIH